ncbi:MAG: acetylglutamate kinase [SAR202 cluster bacterium]|nr:acetylglutamate kinase [SAR202 cluster bacterium]
MTTKVATQQIVLVKIGGSTLGAQDTTLDDVAELRRAGARPVMVHGGGAAVTGWMAKMGIRAEFVRGLRVTDGPSLDVVTAVLAGLINKQLVAALLGKGTKAVGLSGADGALLQGVVDRPELGYVAGKVIVDPSPIHALLDAGYVPVIGPLAVDTANGHHLLNVNADTVAGSIAAALGAKHLVFLTDVDGILDANGRLIARVHAGGAESLIASGVVKGGMIPKLEACAQAAGAGAVAHIVNGTVRGALKGCLNGTVRGTTVD